VTPDLERLRRIAADDQALAKREYDERQEAEARARRILADLADAGLIGRRAATEGYCYGVLGQWLMWYPPDSGASDDENGRPGPSERLTGG
jgi:hypothetical protein